MIRCIEIENPWTKRVCKIGRGITGLGNISNGSRFGCVSEAKKLLMFIRIKSHSLRREMYGLGAEPQVEEVQKTGPHEQCVVDNHVTKNTGFECDPLDYSKYNKVAILCFGCHHEQSENHCKGEIEKTSPKCLGEP